MITALARYSCVIFEVVFPWVKQFLLMLANLFAMYFKATSLSLLMSTVPMDSLSVHDEFRLIRFILTQFAHKVRCSCVNYWLSFNLLCCGFMVNIIFLPFIYPGPISLGSYKFPRPRLFVRCWNARYVPQYTLCVSSVLWLCENRCSYGH